MATVFKRGGKGTRGGRYYIAYFDHKGKRRVHSTRCSDKVTAERIAAKKEADAALRRDGVIDPQLDAICQQSQRTIQSHLKDYEAKMVAVNRVPKHVERTIKCILAITEGAGFERVNEITADGVTRFAGKLRRRGLSSRTVHAYLTAIKGFTKWLANNDKLTRDPLTSIQKPNWKSDRCRERRMLLVDEFHWLRKTTLQGSERCEMTPRERVLLYSVAIQTGLRSSELRSLTNGKLYLDREPPFVLCKSRSTKNRKQARQYIQPSLAAELQDFVSASGRRSQVFKMPDESTMADMLRADLAEARKAWLEEAKHDRIKYIKRQEATSLRK